MNDSTLTQNPVQTKMTEASALSTTDTLALLQTWVDKGWLRRLDIALANFVLELDPSATPTLLVSTAVLAQMEGQHLAVGIDLEALG